MTSFQIGTSTMCTRISKDAADDSLIPFSDRLLNVMKNNRDDKEIKWQYYGSEEGVFVKYPQEKDKVCDVYDPRYRSDSNVLKRYRSHSQENTLCLGTRETNKQLHLSQTHIHTAK